MQPRVVDDDIDLAETLADGLTERGYDATSCASSVQAAKQLEADTVDAHGLLERSRAAASERPVLIMTAYAAVETAIEAIRKGRTTT